MRVLHAIHDFLPRHRAGSEIYASHLARAQAGRHEVFVLAAEYDPSTAHGTLRWRMHDGLTVVELVNNWEFEHFDETYRSPRVNAQLRHVLDATRPDVLHVHNLLNLSFDLPRLARERGIAVVATLHDYTWVCASGGQRVHAAAAHVCHEIDVERCAQCFGESPFAAQMGAARVLGRPAGRLAARAAAWLRRAAPGLASSAARQAGSAVPVTAGDLRLRLAYARGAFDNVDLFIAPSAALAAEYVRLGLPPDRIDVSDYGFRPLASGAPSGVRSRFSNGAPGPVPGVRSRSCTAGPAALEDRDLTPSIAWQAGLEDRDPTPAAPAGATVRVGFVGTLVWHKGAHVLLEAARLLRGPFQIDIHGATGTFPAYTNQLRRTATDLPVVFHDGFEQDRAADVFAGLDVLVVPSLWPENSPLVIHEAFMCGVPVVGARIGGIPGLVSNEINGLLYEPFSPPALAACLQRLIDRPGAIANLAAGIPPVKSIDADAAEWDARYGRLVSRDGAIA